MKLHYFTSSTAFTPLVTATAFASMTALIGLTTLNQAHATPLPPQQEPPTQEECREDACPVGHTCELQFQLACSTCPPVADGDAPVECPGECETLAWEVCKRAACETDADCGDQMKCHTFDTPPVPIAPTAPCQAGESCVPPEPTMYVPESYRQCTPRSELPCEQSSDCGEGYDCVPEELCSCNGATPTTTATAPDRPVNVPAVPTSTGEAPMPQFTTPDPMRPEVDGGAAPLPPPPDCSCSPSGVNRCQVQEIACETQSDCPDNWSCASRPGVCWADSEGNTGCEEGVGRCYPSYDTINQPGGYPGSAPGPTGPSGNGATPPLAQPAPASTTDNAPAPGPGAPVSPPTTEVGTAAPPAHESNNPVAHPHPVEGCSVTTPGGNSPTLWALASAFLGAALLRRRRMT